VAIGKGVAFAAEAEEVDEEDFFGAGAGLGVGSAWVLSAGADCAAAGFRLEVGALTLGSLE